MVPRWMTKAMFGYFCFSTLANTSYRSTYCGPHCSFPIPIIFRLNGLGWPISARFRPHFVVDRRVRKFDQIDRVLNVVIEIFERRQFTRVKLASHAAVENRQRLRADIFAQKKVFVVTQSERLVIVGRRAPVEFGVPTIDDQTAFVQISDRCLPLVTLVQVLPSTMQPPGNRRKPGFISFRSFTRSLRNPLGRFCQVLSDKAKPGRRRLCRLPRSMRLSRALLLVAFARNVAV